MTSRLLTTIVVAFLLGTTGCRALVGAGTRELLDHGDNARYENKSFAQHFSDELTERKHVHDRHCHH